MKPLFDQLAAVTRELELRRRVYPKWMQEGRISEAKARHEIDCFEAAVATLQKLVWIQEIADEEYGRPTVDVMKGPTPKV